MRKAYMMCLIFFTFHQGENGIPGERGTPGPPGTAGARGGPGPAGPEGAKVLRDVSYFVHP